MNSSEPLETDKVISAGPARLLSNWIEIFAIPISSALMETQPIILGLEMVRPYILGLDAALPSALSATLALLIAQWWAMWLQHGREDGLLNSRARPRLRTLSGLLITALVVIALQPLALGDPGFLVASALLVGWSWYRGILRAQEPLNDEYLTLVFRIGFLTLLVGMGFAILSDFQEAGSTVFSQELSHALPIFFLSGLISLSFTRFGRLKREQQDQTGKSGEATGRWLAGMTITWFALVAIAIALEILPLDTLITLLAPLWFVLLLIGQGLLYALGFLMSVSAFLLGITLTGAIWLLNQIFHFLNADTGQDIQKSIEQTAQAVKESSQQSPWLAIILAVAIILIFAIMIFTFTRKKPETSATEEEEEIREALNREEILQERRKRKRKQQEHVALETLPPASMRARYRAFLEAMAALGEETQRRPNETPLEYHRRLLRIAQRRRLLSDESEVQVLEMLTLAYTRERYGSKQVDDETRHQIESQMPGLTEKFAQSPANGWSARRR